jgi:putative DNA primase/helicase
LPTPTWTVETPGGGRHLYFALPEGEVPGNRTGLLRRVDVRGEGGYVIVPPSVRPDGKRYSWILAPW